MEKRNARITETLLGYEDHGIFCLNLVLDYGGTCQGLGGLCLEGERGLRLIKDILGVAGVDSWEKLKGIPVVALFDNKGMNFPIVGLANWSETKTIRWADYFG